MRKIGIWLASILTMVLSLTLTFHYMSGQEKQENLLVAQELCASIKQGMGLEEVKAVVKNIGGEIRAISEEGAMARAPGIGMCRCAFGLENRIVTGVGKAWCNH